MVKPFGRIVGLIAIGLAVAPWRGGSAEAQVRPTAIDVVRARFLTIRAHGSYRAWTNLDEGIAVQQAQTAIVGPLTGQLVAVKDNIDLDWLTTSAGAIALRDRLPRRNATVVDRLLAAGAIIPGHTNMDTWARGVRTVSETHGATANARNPRLGPMGSSGGTAVAVALGDADIGLGTDTCGSIRYPAAANLLYGLRPTPGVISRSGIVPLSPTQDVVGPIGPTVVSLAVVLDVIGGPDPRDPLTAAAPIRQRTYTDELAEASSGALPFRVWRVGVVSSLGPYRRDSKGKTMLDRVRESGIAAVDVSLPLLPLASVIDIESKVIRPMVAAGADERSWLTIGGIGGIGGIGKAKVQVTGRSVEYGRLRAARLVVQARLIDLMDTNRLDALVYPTTPFLPAERGAAQRSANCHLAATGGLPALAIPHGLNADNVPVPGVDLLGRPFQEDTLLALAQRLELTVRA